MSNFIHLYLTHASFWFAVMVALDVHVRGLPKRFKNLLCPAFILSLILGAVTLHGHLNYLQYLRNLG